MRKRQPDSTFKQKPRIPSVTFQPHTYKGFQRGVNLLARAVSPTLGPLPRIVAVEPVGPGPKLPELLESGGTIVRRFLQLRQRDADVGAMFLRHVLWRQHERVGDGTATTAVLFQSIYNQGVRYVVAGGNAMRLRTFLERGLGVILAELEAQARMLETRTQYAQLANALCRDEALAERIAEILDTVSEHGVVDIRSGRTRGLEREYVIGTYYKGRPLSEWILDAQPNRRIELQDAAILICDLDLHEPADLVPLLRLVDREGIESLIILAREASETCISALLNAGSAERPCRILAVKAPDAVTGQAAMLDDIAVLTGARRLLKAAGDSLQKIKAEDLGRARRVWSDDEYFGIISGKGSAQALRSHVAALRVAYSRTDDLQARTKIGERIGKLQGGTAVLWVGGFSSTDIEVRKELAKRTLEAVRATVGKGVVPGGGVALLACRAPLRRLAEQAEDHDERIAYELLIRALGMPARTILRNAGYEPEPRLDEIDRAGPGYGFDVQHGQIVNMGEAGIIDSAGVLRAALHSAIASAALALTIDVIVHKRLPELSLEP